MIVFKQNTQNDGLQDNMSIVENLRRTLKPIFEDWSRIALANHVVVYGIRRYLRGAWLSLHVDNFPYHIAGILQVCTLSGIDGLRGWMIVKKLNFDEN